MLTGVSNDPNGACVADGAITSSVTAIGDRAFAAPGAVMVMVAVAFDAGTRPGTMLTESAPDPEPAAGDTCSHEALDAAVHGTLLPPVCVRSMVCVRVIVCVEFDTMPNMSDVRSDVIVGGVDPSASP